MTMFLALLIAALLDPVLAQLLLWLLDLPVYLFAEGMLATQSALELARLCCAAVMPRISILKKGNPAPTKRRKSTAPPPPYGGRPIPAPSSCCHAAAAPKPSPNTPCTALRVRSRTTSFASAFLAAVTAFVSTARSAPSPPNPTVECTPEAAAAPMPCPKTKLPVTATIRSAVNAALHVLCTCAQSVGAAVLAAGASLASAFTWAPAPAPRKRATKRPRSTAPPPPYGNSPSSTPSYWPAPPKPAAKPQTPAPKPTSTTAAPNTCTTIAILQSILGSAAPPAAASPHVPAAKAQPAAPSSTSPAGKRARTRAAAPTTTSAFRPWVLSSTARPNMMMVASLPRRIHLTPFGACRLLPTTATSWTPNGLDLVVWTPLPFAGCRPVSSAAAPINAKHTTTSTAAATTIITTPELPALLSSPVGPYASPAPAGTSTPAHAAQHHSMAGDGVVFLSFAMPSGKGQQQLAPRLVKFSIAAACGDACRGAITPIGAGAASPMVL